MGNTIGFVLKSKCKYFRAQQLFDSVTNGFDSTLFDKKCSALDYKSMVVIKSNLGHILISFRWKSNDRISCLLQSPTSTVPIIYNDIGPTYHFQNDFVANTDQKLSDIVIDYDSNIAIEQIECPSHDTPDTLSIAQCEVFS